MILDDIVEKRKEQLQREKDNIEPQDMKEMALNSKNKNHGFKEALKESGLSVISEVKKASPSKGVIAEDFRPVETAIAYEEAGAAAISCLTEEHYFKGGSKYFADIRAKVNIPMLRKDFIFDEYQIYEAKVLGADAILLIAAILSEEKIKEFYDLAKSLDLDCLVEVHNEEELKKVIACGCDIIGINNRNLKTFDVDLNTTSKLAPLIPYEAVLVSESGMKDENDMKNVKEQGADAVLVAVPVLAIEKVMAQIEPFLGDDTLITDVGSVRGVVIDGARRVLKEKFVNYAPVHPIAGGEMPGVDYADADLFVGAKAISTPVNGIGERAVRFWEEAWKTAGSDLLRMTPEEHDAVFASVSHLPHLLSYAMVDSILNTGSAERKLSLAGAGFRDFTRIAASSPEMWVDIFRANKKAVLEALSYFEKDLALLRRAVENDKVEVTRSVFARAADARRRIAPHLPKKRS